MTHAMSPSAAPAAPADPHAGMQMSQTTGARAYQSFSYEPGAAPQLQPVIAPRYRMMPTAPTLHQNSAATGKFR
ncbi:MAG TPA: hypothetical protein VM165_16125 [Planctomycetaceae bacterium]|nr:hypothetical protein [Planctomycetaceae bacterium]